MLINQQKFLQQKTFLWFSQNGRDLPWRHTHDPYKVLVSEVMLQQTGVDRVLPKYVQFIQAYPTVKHLAQAPTADLIKIWHPLGYNRRPLRLKAIAVQIETDFGGQFPNTFDQLLLLKGIGPYTAGAIMCFAYERDIAIIDTNIRRIVHRWFVGSDIPQLKMKDKDLQDLAQKVLPPGQGYAWNGALMDFGSAICTSNNPQCPLCPLQSQCCAYPQIMSHKRVRGVAKEKFVDSNRYFRGKTLRILGSHPPNLTLEALGFALKSDFEPITTGRPLSCG